LTRILEKKNPHFKLSFLSGDYETFVAMLLDGYDHIIDISDNDGASITKVARSRGHHELANFLDNLRDFEVSFEFCIIQ
jgi:hypothetical protein